MLPIAVAHRAFGHLLRERVWPRDPVAVFEALTDAATMTRDPRELAEAARRIVVPRREDVRALCPLILAPAFEAELGRMWSADGGLAPDPRTALHVREAVARYAADTPGPHALVVTAPLRPLRRSSSSEPQRASPCSRTRSCRPRSRSSRSPSSPNQSP